MQRNEWPSDLRYRHGLSYLVELGGENWKFRGEKKHLNYYLNHDVPILIILVDVENEVAYWEVCKAEYVELNENTWTMPIPKDQKISLLQREKLLKFVPKTVDYVSQLEEYWLGNKLLSDTDRLFLFVGKDDIKEMNYLPLIELIKRICSNKHHLSKFMENIEIGIHGFDADRRELYEIPEIKNWITNIFKFVPGLTYFLTNDNDSQFLKVFVFSSVKLEIIDKNLEKGKVWVEFDNKYLEGIFNTLFGDLNDFTDAFEMPEQINKEISNNLAKCITGRGFLDT